MKRLADSVGGSVLQVQLEDFNCDGDVVIIDEDYDSFLLEEVQGDEIGGAPPPDEDFYLGKENTAPDEDFYLENTPEKKKRVEKSAILQTNKETNNYEEDDDEILHEFIMDDIEDVDTFEEKDFLNEMYIPEDDEKLEPEETSLSEPRQKESNSTEREEREDIMKMMNLLEEEKKRQRTHKT